MADPTPDDLVPFDAWPPSQWSEFAAQPAAAPPVDDGSEAAQPYIDALYAQHSPVADARPPEEYSGQPATVPLSTGPIAPPPPAVDAITGAASPPLESYVGDVHTEPVPPPGPTGPNVADPSYLDQMSGQDAALPSIGDREVANANDEKAKYYAAHPDALARDNVEAEGAKRSAMIADQARINTEDAKQAVADHLRHQTAIAKIQQDSQQVIADSTKLANTKIDPNLHPGIFGAIGNVIALTLGGAMSQYTGGRNLALEQLNKAIDNHIDAQKSDLANQWRGMATRREGIADAQAQEADQAREDTTFRMGVYGRAMNDLQTQMQNFDPRSSLVRELGGQYAQLGAAQQKAMAAYQKTAWDSAIKVDESKQKWAVSNETQRHNMVEEDAKAKAAALKAAGTGAGGAGKADALAHENQLTAGLAPHDRERAIFSPDGKSYMLAADHEAAVAQRGEIASGKAALGAADSVIADLLNEPGLMAKLKAKAGLNPQELAVIKSKLSLLKPMIAKVAAGTGRIPLAELHAVDAATDDPSSFTSETLAQIQAMRDATVNDLVDKFGPEYPGFITKESFGHAPTIAPAPDAHTIAAPLKGAPVKGDKGYAAIDATNVDGQLKQLFQHYVDTPTIPGPNTPGGPEQAQKDYQSDLDDIVAARHDAINKISADVTRLSAVKKPTPAQTEQLHGAIRAMRTEAEVIRNVGEWRQKGVERAKEERRRADLAKELEDAKQHAPSNPYGGG